MTGSATGIRIRIAIAHLDPDDEAQVAVHVGHGCQREQVPEGLAVLLVVQQPHAGLGARAHRLPDLSHRGAVRAGALQGGGAEPEPSQQGFMGPLSGRGCSQTQGVKPDAVR